jgi:MFS family permease
VSAIALAHVGGWRTFYWVAAALAAVAAVAARLILRESRAAKARSLDPLGVLLLSAALTGLLVGATNGRSGWARPATIVPIVLAVGLFAVFALVESRVAEPMLELGLFSRAPFQLATLGALFTGIAVIGPMTFLPTALQRGSGMTATHTALLASAWAFSMFLVGLAARRMPSSAHGGWELTVGFLVSALGSALIAVTVDQSWAWLLPGMVLAGLGGGLINATLPRLAVSTVPPERVAMGSGANNTARYLGSSLGVAVTASLAPTNPTETLVVGIVLCAFAAAAVLPLMLRSRVLAAAPA